MLNRVKFKTMKEVSSQHGFTLIEMLVSIAIFITAFSAISGIFVYSSRTQRITEEISKIQSDARFSMEIMAQHVRRSSIDYSSSEYGGEIVSNPQIILVLRDISGDKIWFRRNIIDGVGCIEMSENSVDWARITPLDVSVDLLKFYLSPTTDPFLDSSTSNIQPKVTIVMRTSGASSAGKGIFPTFLQTTVSSRRYER